MSLQEKDPIAAPGTQVEIRDYEPRRDREDVIRCVAALQDFERSLEPNLPPGERIAAMSKPCSSAARPTRGVCSSRWPIG